MPVSTYSHYKDPETGKVILLPKLFPHASCSVTTSTEEIKNWVSSGVIPQKLYESDLQSKLKMEEIHKRIEGGETVSASELPPTPWALTDHLIKNKASLYGESVLKHIFFNLEKGDPDIVWLSFIKEAITSITSRDPLPVHFLTARKYLKEKLSIEDSTAVDILARKIVEHCENIKKFKALNHTTFNKITIDPEDLNEHFEDENGGILSLDMDLINYLKGMGGVGKKEAEELRKNCGELYDYYKNNNYPSRCRPELWSVWVPCKTEEKGISLFLFLIAKVAWNVSCSKIWHRQSKQFPAITKPIIQRIKPILNPKKKKKFIEHEGSIVCTDETGSLLIIAPSIDSNMIALLKKGVKDWFIRLIGSNRSKCRTLIP